MVSSVSLAGNAALAYSTATTTGAASSASGAAASNGVKAAAPAGAGPAVTITLSPNAQRLQTAINNLTALETSGTSLAGVWDQDDFAAGVDLDQEPTADAEVAALPASDPAHIAQATAAQTFVKAKLAAAPSAGTVSAPNPFAGASTQSLVAIISDKSGLYTHYEKAAASYEYQDQQNEFIDQYGPGNPANDNSAGKATYYSKVLSTYNALPSLVQAVYPADYVQSVTKLQQFYASGKDDNDLPSFFGKSPSKGSLILTLLESSTKPSRPGGSKLDSRQPVVN